MDMCLKNIVKISVVLSSFILAVAVQGCINNTVATQTATPGPTAAIATATPTPTPTPTPTATIANGSSPTIHMVQQTTNGRTYPTTPLNVSVNPNQKDGGLTAGELGHQG